MYSLIYGLDGLGLGAGFLTLAIIIGLWDAVWKAIGLWKSGTQRQLVWFICIFIFNTAGILPIVYLLWFQRDKKHAASSRRR